jgi:hypothetical protein
MFLEFDMDGFIAYMESEVKALENKTDAEALAMMKVYEHILVLIDFRLFEKEIT